MDVIHQRCAGLDVHKESVVACVRLVIDGKVKQEVRTFGTTTTELLSLTPNTIVAVALGLTIPKTLLVSADEVIE